MPSIKDVGIITTKEVDQNGNLWRSDIEPGESIRIFGSIVQRGIQALHFERTFQLGEVALYRRWEIAYTGEIVGISDYLVTVRSKFGVLHRVEVEQFIRLNWNLDLEVIQRRNSFARARMMKFYMQENGNSPGRP